MFLIFIFCIFIFDKQNCFHEGFSYSSSWDISALLKRISPARRKLRRRTRRFEAEARKVQESVSEKCLLSPLKDRNFSLEDAPHTFRVLHAIPNTHETKKAEAPESTGEISKIVFDSVSSRSRSQFHASVGRTRSDLFIARAFIAFR